MFWITLSQILDVIINVLVMLIIVQFVIGMLFAFNVISPSNGFLMQFYQGINAFLSPILNPIRRIMPKTGMMDFSPLVLIMGLTILQIVVNNLAYSLA